MSEQKSKYPPNGPLLSAHAALNVHVTNRCALVCRHCLYSSGERTVEEMSTAELIHLIHQFSELCGGQGTLNLYGGEPLLRTDIFDVVAGARAVGMRVGITTSGIAPRMAVRGLSAAGFSRATVDLHSAQAEVHDWIRARPGHHEESLSLIRSLRAAGVPVAVNCALNRRNAGGIFALLNLCATLEVMSVSFYLLNPIGRGASLVGEILNGPAWIEARTVAQQWLVSHDAAFSVVWERSYVTTSEQEHLGASLCRRERADSISVRSDGKVYFCCLLSSGAAPMVDVATPALGDVRREPLALILSRRSALLYTDVVGCPALGLHAAGGRNLADPRVVEAGVHPACPYDWQLLRGSVDTMRDVFAPLQP